MWTITYMQGWESSAGELAPFFITFKYSLGRKNQTSVPPDMQNAELTAVVEGTLFDQSS